ncbi:MAG: phosphoribosyltransferase [Nitrososphaeraceae archaeon]
MKFETEVSEKKSPKVYCNWDEVESLTRTIADKIRRSKNKEYDAILAVTRGGIIPARLMARELGINYIQLIPVRDKKLYIEEMPVLRKDKKYLVIDEIYDTGNTFYKVHDAVKIFDCDFAFLMSRYDHNNRGTYIGKVLNHNKWIVFPWE